MQIVSPCRESEPWCRPRVVTQEPEQSLLEDFHRSPAEGPADRLKLQEPAEPADDTRLSLGYQTESGAAGGAQPAHYAPLSSHNEAQLLHIHSHLHAVFSCQHTHRWIKAEDDIYGQ